MDDDQELVKRTLKGDKGAFEMIIRRYQQPVLNYIGRMVGERQLALDISQDIFIKVYSSLRSYRPQFKFSTWLYQDRFELHDRPLAEEKNPDRIDRPARPGRRGLPQASGPRQ